MNIAFFYERVDPARGGCETYITDISRRLLAEGHEVHIHACRWAEDALPDGIQLHRLPAVSGPHWLRHWRFGAECERAMKRNRHDVTVGLSKTWGQDVLYPQGGLYAASFDYNLDKYQYTWQKMLAVLGKWINLTQFSFRRLERKQYLSQPQPTVIVNSHMVRSHFQKYYGIPAGNVHVVRSAIDPGRFNESDRLRRRQDWRQTWGLGPEDTVGLLAAMNYRLKGLGPLLHAIRHLFDVTEFRSKANKFRLLVAGHPKYHRYQRLAQRLGIADRIHFVGHCPDMRNAYFAADFLVHPTFYDPCSLVVLEAFACSLPVITTRSNGASELMQPLQQGYVIDDPHDHARMAWCIAQLLDPQRRQHCAQGALRAAERWTFDHHYRALLQVFQRTMTRRQAA